MADDQHFSGEDENAGFASPAQDLIAATFLVLLSLWVMVESVRLENPGSLVTAPGLLPFLTAGSLAVMALWLGVMALRRKRADADTVPPESSPEMRRTLILFALIGAYLAGLELIRFDYVAPVGGFRIGFGSFEALTIIALCVILSIYWRKALWACLAVSVVWTVFLAGVFRYVFTIPLPGSI
jgi:hypothetical protein